MTGVLISTSIVQAATLARAVTGAVPTFGLPQVFPTPTPTACVCPSPSSRPGTTHPGSKPAPTPPPAKPGYAEPPPAQVPQPTAAGGQSSVATAAPTPAGLNPSLPPSVAFLGPPGGLAPAGTLLSWPLFAGIDALALLSVLFALRKSGSRTAAPR